jgi:hypothetical protein
MRRANFSLAIVWAVMIPVSLLTGWIYSIPFIAAASIYANFITHVSAWRADVPTAQEPAAGPIQSPSLAAAGVEDLPAGQPAR